MPTIPVVPITPPIIPPAIQGSDAGDQYENDGAVSLYVVSDNPADFQIELVAQRQPFEPLSCLNKTYTITAGGTTQLPCVDRRWFNDAGGFVQVRYPPGVATNCLLFAVRNPNVR